MKVTVYQGKNFVLCNEFVLKKVATQPLLQTVLVIVPDRFTLQTERILLKQQSHLLNTRVITFSMLYRMVASELNQGNEPAILDKTSAVMALWHAIRQVQGQLTWFKNSAGHYDFAEKMFNTINQMRSSCVDFTTLADKAQSVVAQKKYHDINLIYQAYQQIIASVTDTSGMLEYLIAHLGESQTIKNAVVYLCGFSSLSPARLQVLSVVCHTAKEVMIAASEPELNQQLSQYPHYQIQTPPFTPQLDMVRCTTERGEATIIMERIVQLINQGVAPENIVVLLNEFDTMAPVWQVVADQYHVPINLDVGTKLSTTADAKYLRDLLELAANDDAENTVAVLFNQCSGIADETVYGLENQIIKTNLRARAIPEIQKLAATKDTVALCTQLKSLTTNEKLQHILDQIIEGYGTQPLNLRELIALFWTLCSATKVSKIPQYIDRVLIAPIEEWVPSTVQYLLIAHCTPENFPRGQADNDILQEADLFGTQITPIPSLQRERNARHAELLKTVASVQVTLSGTCEEFTAVPYQPRYSFQLRDDQSPLTVGKALFFPHQRVKTTMLERYYTCPRLNFIQNGLGLYPRPLYQLQANTVGSAIHAALQSYFVDHDLDQAVQIGIQTLAFDYPPLTNNIAKEIRFILVKLSEIFAQGQFQLATEVEKTVTRPLQHGLTLVGRVDRVDVADLGHGERALLVLDYKSGNVSGSLPKSIYLGYKLQLPVYSSALSAMGKIAGAGYLPLSSGYANDEKKFFLKGFVDQAQKHLLPPDLINPNARYYVSIETINRMCDHANRLVNQAVERLMAGCVVAQAVEKGVCQYCPMKVLCSQAEINCRGENVNVTFKTFEENQG